MNPVTMSNNEINTNHIMNEGVHDDTATAAAAEMEEPEEPSHSQAEAAEVTSSAHGPELTAVEEGQMEEIEKSQTEREGTMKVSRGGRDLHIPVTREGKLHESERPSQAEAIGGMAATSGGQGQNTIASEGKGKEKEAKVYIANTIDLASENYSGGFDTPAAAGQTNVLPRAGSQDATAGPSNEIAPSHIPLPHYSSSETASLTASSISNPALEVDVDFDDGFSDTDSAITDLRQKSTTSVRSSVYEFVEENGRTFHRYKEGKYILPNDETEQNRLDLQHQMLLIMLDGRLYLAPIKPDLQDVLDVGTGTGIWAIEFAMKYPSARVIGTDLSPIQPEFVPPNCQFEVDDAEDDWMFTRPFDFVHMRGMMTCFRNPRDIIAKAYAALKPGGFLETAESIFPMHCHDDTLEGTALDSWGKKCVEAGKILGREWTNGVHYKRWMEELGFEDVREKIFEVPTSPWPKGRKQKELGMWWQADILDALGGTISVFTRGLGWEPAEVERLLVDVRKDIKDRGVHAYMPIHVVYGRKPKEAKAATTST